MAGRFAGEVALISGAGRGFGRHLAERLARQGAHLVLSDIDEPLLAATLDHVRDGGGQAEGIAGDVAEEGLHAALVGLARSRFGRLDMAVNNAGIAQPSQRLHDTDPALAARVIAVDLMAVFLAMRAQIPLLLEGAAEGRQGRVLNVASAAGLMGSPMLAVYSAAKHGVVGLTRSAAIEYGRKGLRINCICPAFTRTEMVLGPLRESPHGAEKAEGNMTAVNPMQRLGEVDEVVQAMVWALDPANSFFNGQALAIDGGLSA